MIDTVILWAAYALAVLVILSPVMSRMRPYALAALERSAYTRTQVDDVLAKVWLWACDAPRWLVAVWPRLTLGLEEIRRVRDAIKAIERPRPPDGGAGSATLLALLVAFGAMTSSACGATQVERARTILSVSGQSVVAAEHAFAPAYAEAGERARASSATVEEYLEAIRPWTSGALAIDLTGRALRLAETQIDAIEQGAAGDVGAVLACVGTSLVQLLDTLDTLVEVPPLLMQAVSIIGGVASGRCEPAVAVSP